MTNHLFLLYIDPGTGSALFSIIIGLAAAVYFLFQALFIKFKVFITGGKAKHGAKNKFVIYAEDKRYWTLFKPIVEEFEKREIEILYLTSSQDDPVFETGCKYVKAEYLGEGNKAFTRLNFLSADFVLSTTPGLNVYQWRRSKMVKHYGHIFHTPVEAPMYELFGMDYFDSILIPGHDSQIEYIRNLEKIRNLPKKQIVTVGCPYLDEYAKKMASIPPEESHIFTVLVSPSWGKTALLSRFGKKLLDPLAKTGWRIIVRPNPQSLIVEKELIERLSKRYAEISCLEWDFKIENIFSLKKADVMISDYSNIMLDFIFLCNKPVLYVSEKLDLRTRDAFHAYETQDEFWTFQKLKKMGIELKQEMFEALPDLISRVSLDTTMKSARDDAKAEAWNCQGEAGKYAADFMIKTAEEINNK